MTDLAALQPLDEHNRVLESQVHPPDWVNPTASGRYNLVVIGGGPAGLVTAAGAAGLGAKVALIERSLMGGDCLNVGCVPSKGLIRAARAAAAVRDAGEFGVSVPEYSVDFAAAMTRMRRLRAGLSHHDSPQRFTDLGVDVYLGQGQFTGEGSIEVAGQTLQFRRAVVCTGARAAELDIPGLSEVEYLTNESVFSLTELPPRLIVVGGGPIGTELAQTFARLGSQVTQIEKADQILSREDQSAAAVVQESLRRDGVELLLNSVTTKVTERGAEKVVTVTSAGVEREVVGDALLLGIGRAPNVEGLGLESVGVQFDSREGISVDDRLRTSNSTIYAAGDVCSRYRFTHAADAMARIVIANTLFMGRGKVSALTIPWVTYTSPELAHVGLSQEQAAREGTPVDVFTQPLSKLDRALLDGEATGFVEVLTARGKDRIVGATIVAENAGDMIGEISLAMTHGLGLKQIASTIHPYPTQAEAIRKVADSWNRTRLTPLVKSLMTTWLRWTR